MAKKRSSAPPSEAMIREANRRHDAEFSKEEIKAYRKTNNSFYKKAENGDTNRESLGTGWSNRWQNSYASKSAEAQNAILKNQINIKKNRKK